MMMQEISNWVYGSRHGLLMVVVQLALAWAHLLYKMLAADGMNLRILIAYRYLFASALMVPLAIIYERNTGPRITLGILSLSFLCGLFGGTLSQNFLSESVALISATFAAAMSHTIPAITFILGIAFGLERLELGTRAGKAKVIGTIIVIVGAMVLTFYRGPLVEIWSTNIDLLPHHSQSHRSHVASSHGNLALGALMAILGCFAYALWFICQAKLTMRYPCHYSTAALMTSMAAIQSTVGALCLERDWSQWKLGWNIRLFASLYLGIITSAFVLVIMTWCVSARGPFFVATFQPLTLVGVAVVGSLVLEEKLHVGSIVGAAFIVCGLYMVLWGKSKEMKQTNEFVPSNNQESETIKIVATSSSGPSKIVANT